MARQTITQTNGLYPRAPLVDDDNAEAVGDMLNEHAAALDSLPEAASSLMSVGPVAAKGTDDVHAIYDDTDADLPGPFTDPDVPRNLRVVKAASWDGGTILVTGTDQFDAAQTELFPALTAGTEVGTKIFKTVTAAVKSVPAGVAGDGVSIGTGDLIGLNARLRNEVGLAFVAGVPEEIVLDDGVDAFTPDTTPAATTYLVLANVGTP